MRKQSWFLAGLAALLVLALTAAPLAADTITATAGSGGVAAHTFVKLSSAGVVVTATAVTDSVVGVAEDTAAANAMTRYTLPGARTTITSGEAIAVGDLLTAGTSGRAYVLDADDASTQRVCGVALTATASGAGESIQIVVVASACEQRLALAGNVSVSGSGTFTTGTGAVTLAGDVTISGSKTFATGTGAVTLSGDVTVSAGKDISLAAGAGYIEANGATSGGIRIDPIDVGTSMTTLVNSAAASPPTIAFPAMSGQFIFTPGASTTVAGDVLVIPVTHAIVAKTTANDAEALTLADGKPGQVLTVVLVTDGGGDGTLTPSRKTGWNTLVFADAGDVASLLYVDDVVGWVILGTHGLAGPPAGS